MQGERTYSRNGEVTALKIANLAAHCQNQLSVTLATMTAWSFLGSLQSATFGVSPVLSIPSLMQFCNIVKSGKVIVLPPRSCNALFAMERERPPVPWDQKVYLRGHGEATHARRPSTTCGGAANAVAHIPPDYDRQKIPLQSVQTTSRNRCWCWRRLLRDLSRVRSRLGPRHGFRKARGNRHRNDTTSIASAFNLTSKMIHGHSAHERHELRDTSLGL